MFALSQKFITSRIFGKYLHKVFPEVKVYSGVSVVDGYSRYNLIAYGYTVKVSFGPDGDVESAIRIFGRTACTSQTLAGAITLIKNCKRWSQEATV